MLTTAQADTIALWILHAHSLDAFDVSPYLSIESAEKRSGKTTLLRALEYLVPSPWRVIQPSEAVLYRKIAQDRPTLLLDEIDTIFSKGNEHEPLRAIFNAGNERGVSVPRCAGPAKDKLEEYAVYCCKAFAGIGRRLPDTVTDRSIVIRLRRKARSERVARSRRRDVRDALAPVRAQCLVWSAASISQLASARPDLPDELDDRAQDAWEALLAVADLAGGEWPQRARSAAIELSGGAVRDDDSTGIRLLADIRRVFGETLDRISTVELIAALAADDEAPWGSWGRQGAPITPRALSKFLAEHDIKSRSVRLEDGTTPKGFTRGQFDDAWERYL